MYYTCINCGYVDQSRTQTVSKTDHNWQTISETPATCTSPGVVLYRCSLCGEEDGDQTNALGHDYSASVEKSEAFVSAQNCTHGNLYHYSCTRCGEVEQDVYDGETLVQSAPSFSVGDALGHNYRWSVTETRPICVVGHYMHYVCTTCGYEDEGAKQWIAKTDHNWETISETPATCTSAGVVLYRCKLCGEEDEDQTNALGHDYNASVEKSEALASAQSCTHGNIYHYSCTRCGEVEQDVYDGETLVQSAPTFTVGEALGHSIVVDTDVAATCTTDGEYHEHCTRCGDNYYERRLATGHVYNEDNICTVCGDVKGTTECVDGTHNFVDGCCTICGAWNTEFAVSFYADGECFKRIGASTGETVYLPTAPAKKGYDFVTYKYYNDSGEYIKFTDTTRIYDNINVYAVYEGVYITVHITDSVTGETLDVKILEAYTLGNSYTPVKHIGYVFTGYTRDGADIPFSEDTPILEEYHLTANYEITLFGRVIDFVQGLSIWVFVILVIGIVVMIVVFNVGKSGSRKRRSRKRK